MQQHHFAVGPNVAKAEETKPEKPAKITAVRQPIEIKPLNISPIKFNDAALEKLRYRMVVAENLLTKERDDFNIASRDFQRKLKAADERIVTLEAEKLQLQKPKIDLSTLLMTEELTTVRHALTETKQQLEIQNNLLTTTQLEHNELVRKLYDSAVRSDALSAELQSLVRCKQEVEAEVASLEDEVTRQKEKRLKEKEGHDIVVKYLILNIDELRETKQRLIEKVTKLKQKLEDDEMPPLIQVR